MLQIGNQMRFTPQEVHEARALGIDLVGVKTMDQYSKAVIDLISILESDRPALLKKIARALAVATGAKLPPKLKRVVD